MSPRESRTVTLALSILRHAAESVDHPGRTGGVQLARRVLLPYADRFTLTTYWNVAANPNRSHRAHNLKRVFETIERRVRQRIAVHHNG